jgi:dihydroneopterin aldolase/2-amino-4-hydroxy-6-hydroxymethyldihydropteridine diphosphokinase
MTVAFLSLGSNIEPEKHILDAVKLLSRHVKIVKTSTVYLTKPLHRKSQPKYYNCVIKIETTIPPSKLKFDVLRAIEDELGRERTKDKYASRTIDIDLILYEDRCFSTNDLVIPDPEIQKRAFLAIPLAEIEPNLELPESNKSIKEIADKFKKSKITPLKEFTETLQNCLRSLRM